MNFILHDLVMKFSFDVSIQVV